MNKKEIKEKYENQWGVFTHDMYKATDEEYANGFLGAFEKFKEAFVLANKCEIYSIHLI